MAVEPLQQTLQQNRALPHRSTTEALRPAADVELYSSTALQSALHLYSSTALYTLHPLHAPSADGHHRCFWLRHRSTRAQCARRHQASTPVRRAACCADGFLWLSSRAFWRPGGWENMCRLLCHCVRHIGLDNKHGRSVEAIHSFLSRWKACTELCAGTQKSRAARRARWGARTVRFSGVA